MTHKKTNPAAKKTFTKLVQAIAVKPQHHLKLCELAASGSGQFLLENIDSDRYQDWLQTSQLIVVKHLSLPHLQKRLDESIKRHKIKVGNFDRDNNKVIIFPPSYYFELPREVRALPQISSSLDLTPSNSKANSVTPEVRINKKNVNSLNEAITGTIFKTHRWLLHGDQDLHEEWLENPQVVVNTQVENRFPLLSTTPYSSKQSFTTVPAKIHVNTLMNQLQITK